MKQARPANRVVRGRLSALGVMAAVLALGTNLAGQR